MGPRAGLDGCRKSRPHWEFFFFCVFLYSLLHPYLILCLDCLAFCVLSLLTTQHKTSMPPAGFEPPISASERSQTHTLNRSATGGLDPGTVQPIVTCYTDWAIPADNNNIPAYTLVHGFITRRYSIIVGSQTSWHRAVLFVEGTEKWDVTFHLWRHTASGHDATGVASWESVRTCWQVRVARF